jgi:general secretion pathway protein C
MKFRRPTVENKGWTWWLGFALSLCLLFGAIAYWASIWLAPAVRIAPAGSLSDQSGPMNLAQAQGLFGQVTIVAPPVSVAAPSNIKVQGILAAGQKGSAVLTIDGKPGKVFMLGDKVDGQLKLIAVDVRQVTLGQDGTTARQTLPAPVKADISVLTQGAAKSQGGGTTPSSSPGSGPFQAPGFSPNPGNPMTPPPSSMLSPPPIISPGQGGQIVSGLPMQPPNSTGAIILPGSVPATPPPLPNGQIPGPQPPGPQPTQ